MNKDIKKQGLDREDSLMKISKNKKEIKVHSQFHGVLYTYSTASGNTYTHTHISSTRSQCVKEKHGLPHSQKCFLLLFFSLYTLI